MFAEWQSLGLYRLLSKSPFERWVDLPSCFLYLSCGFTLPCILLLLNFSSMYLPISGIEACTSLCYQYSSFSPFFWGGGVFCRCAYLVCHWQATGLQEDWFMKIFVYCCSGRPEKADCTPSDQGCFCQCALNGSVCFGNVRGRESAASKIWKLETLLWMETSSCFSKSHTVGLISRRFWWDKWKHIL